MKKILIIFITALFPLLSAFSQSPEPYQSKWIIKPGFGRNYGFTKLLEGNITDPLFQYGEKGMQYWQFLAVTYFYKEQWGIELVYQPMTAKNLGYHQKSVFQKGQEELYGTHYYVTTSTGIDEFAATSLNSYFERGALSLVGRYEKNRLIFYPKFSIGVMSFYTNWGKIKLKEKNSNMLLQVDYIPKKISNDFLFLGVSGTVGVKITKWLFTNLDLMALYYRPNIQYTKETTDLFLRTQTKEIIPYKKNMVDISVGASTIIVIRNSRTKSK